VKALPLTLALVALLAAGCGGGSTSSAPLPTTVPLRSADGTLNVAIKVFKHGKQVIALVPVTIDGKGPFTFALDTGASQSLVDSAVAKKLGVHTTGDSHRVAGITNVTKVQTIVVKHWQVGRVKLPSTTVVEANLPFGNADGGVQGLLGSDMLSQFDVVTIDYGRGVLRLHKRVVRTSHG
jgi:predicted aspartyl protease